MDTEQIIRLIETVSKSSLTEFEYSEGDMKLVLKAGAPAAVAAPKAPQKAEPVAPAAEEEFVDDGTWIKSPWWERSTALLRRMPSPMCMWEIP